MTDPIRLQRLEGGILLALSLLLYWRHGASWLLLLVLIFQKRIVAGI